MKNCYLSPKLRACSEQNASADSLSSGPTPIRVDRCEHLDAKRFDNLSQPLL